MTDDDDFVIPFGDILQILKGKVANPFVSSKQKFKILDALKRQIDWCNGKRIHKDNFIEDYQELNNECRALAMVDDDE